MFYDYVLIKNIMKNLLIFIAGMVVGAVALLVVSLGIFKDSITNDGITMFSTQGESLSENNFKIFQVLDSGNALALEESDDYRIDNIIVLFLSQEGKYYYDNEIIKVPAGKCVRQIGVYKYFTKTSEKTVPIVKVSDK